MTTSSHAHICCFYNSKEIRHSSPQKVFATREGVEAWKKLAFIDSNRNAIHEIMCIDCSSLRRPQLAFQEEEQEDGK